MTGYALEGAIDYSFPMDSWISAGEYLLVVSNKSSYQNLGCQVFEWSKGKLSNAGETLSLIDSNGITVTEISYSDQAPWPVLADRLFQP